MGIVNATPDSFSGGFPDPEQAVAHGLRLIEDGADILDLGGESTRPGAKPTPEAEELARVLPVLGGLRRAATGRVTISIDTMKPAVARSAISAGAAMWNDVSGLTFAPESLETAADLRCAVVLMHMQGDPRTMQAAPRYGDVVGEVCAWLEGRAEAAVAAGIAEGAIWFDPGIGFGKSVAHNLALIARLDAIAALGFPVLLGVSRKGFLRAIGAGGADPCDRLAGSLAAALAGVQAGVAALRVHDVRDTVRAMRFHGALERARREARHG